MRTPMGAQEGLGALAGQGGMCVCVWEPAGRRRDRVESLLPARGQQHLRSPVPACGHVLCQGLALRPLREVAERAGQAKVTELHQAAGIQENVGRLGERKWAEG